MHIAEDDLILFFYGEARRPVAIERHLSACPACSGCYAELLRTLTLVRDDGVPVRGERYGLEVWQRLRGELPLQEPARGLFALLRWNYLTMTCTAALLVIVAFAAGRSWPLPAPQPALSVQTAAPALPAEVSERARAAAIADHLDQSERVLMDVVNAAGSRVDVSATQAAADHLIDSNRLYREAALLAGDAGVASVLDDLERSLLEIVHGPSVLTPLLLQQVRKRANAAAVLFKVRVLSEELHQRELDVYRPAKTA